MSGWRVFFAGLCISIAVAAATPRDWLWRSVVITTALITAMRLLIPRKKP